jgi:3-deoxy-7-phosphoheptulonate synthase
MQADADASQSDEVVGLLRSRGYEVHALQGGGTSVIGINGQPVTDDLGPALRQLPGVATVVTPSGPYKLAAREVRPGGTVVRAGEIEIGGLEPVIIAGPCAVESREQALQTAAAVQSVGARMLRGGAFKPRTSPYSFQGLGDDGLKLLAEMRELTGLPVVTEVMEPEQVEHVADYADVLQVGSRNMMNFPLLRRIAKTNKPVLLKRGFAATIEEWLLSAEYILAGGNDRVILCERGIRGFDSATRFTLDLNAVPLARQLTHLPILVDPSHGTGKRELVPAMSLAGIAAGAHGLIIEVHPNPEAALSDGRQSITPETLADIIDKTRAVSALLQPDLLAV